MLARCRVECDQGSEPVLHHLHCGHLFSSPAFSEGGGDPFADSFEQVAQAGQELPGRGVCGKPLSEAARPRSNGNSALTIVKQPGPGQPAAAALLLG
jgi:hypothetical protein